MSGHFNCEELRLVVGHFHGDEPASSVAAAAATAACCRRLHEAAGRDAHRKRIETQGAAARSA